MDLRVIRDLYSWQQRTVRRFYTWHFLDWDVKKDRVMNQEERIAMTPVETAEVIKS
ncbi:MAG: hypothetical protein KHW82_05430 [Lachnospiraceae bacterium]|nr:hypothetical protein [Lachnospiraceae bacterium]